MKIEFAPDFPGNDVEMLIGDQRFEFHGRGTPFEVSEEVGAYCLRLGYFVATPTEAPAVAVAPTAQEVAPRKK
ncbi:MAG TPA: hypothetical protein PLD20_00985 [Blastocatellia bacterium]|nr:hypothetical protein [Blastocatellia bacterium]HMV81822.1 hypothetical protein [Blastocatellia bacterium]HMX23997.1 hypothetical protein [Blastocatellia bacterium]HMY70427.1 hypothetical protein [Blastocatellia bacterium]HMZ16510.1 hypothetical protein [Blastocatellia bacterium]